MKTEIPVYYENDVIPSLIRYCESNHLKRFFLVADQNTYIALGRSLQDALTGRGLDVRTILLTGDEILTNEHYIVRVLAEAGREDRVYLAVGSGTITDIVRFVSHRTKTIFISVPTAPSVDAYSGAGAPTVIGGFKKTIQAQPPAAIFADLNTLCAAPRPMIASGFGDILGKYTALPDWELGQLLWAEPYSDEIARRAWHALGECVEHVDEIASASPGGIRTLTESLIESGLCMLDFDGSAPASGAEHHISHVLEAKLIQENRPAILHGAKVGAACILVARYYEQIRGLTQDRVKELLAGAPMYDREHEMRRIRAAYPANAERVVAEQAPFMELSEDGYEGLKRRIIDCWAEVLQIVAKVPPAPELADILHKVGGPVSMKALGLDDAEVAFALEYAHYYRNRFTVLKLCYVLGVKPELTYSNL
jgi:glycerol-1-phosphate dehydrogenase [NAD(P)+]